MIKWMLIVVASLAGAAAVVHVIGIFVPKSHRVARTVVVNASPDRVFALIADVTAAPEWRSSVTKVEELTAAAGVGRRFRETGANGAVTFVVSAFDPPRRVVSTIDDPSLPFGGSWTFDLAPAGAGTSLTITEAGEVYSPMFRFFGLFMSKSASIDAYLAALQKRLGGA